MGVEYLTHIASLYKSYPISLHVGLLNWLAVICCWQLVNSDGGEIPYKMHLPVLGSLDATS